ncbi:MAG TPA: T9SS type A sorting domain-containing protein, partial [Hanamia sp.]|nr:T9SS type A sorting domain-containing protein [Hanamia sp.]
EEPLLYPNPAKNLLGIYKGGEEILDVKIYNSRGVLVIEKQYSTGQTNITINISNLQNGLYYVKIKTSQSEYTEQLVVLR